MLVSIVINALNEEKYLPGVFSDILDQDYDHKKIEVILVNAMSTDNTRNIMENFRDRYIKEFKKIKVVDNQNKTLTSGFNLGVKNSEGDAILKIDAHASVPSNFVRENVKIIQQGEYVCGGPRPTIVDDDSDFAHTLHLVEENMFGSSFASYRKGSGNKYVKSVFHGMYKREVFENAGLNDEQLIRTEDNELNYRIRENGYKIRYSDNIESYQFIRPTLWKMLKQKYGNGYWVGLTAHVRRKCLSIFHFIPAVFVAIFGVTRLIKPIWKKPYRLLMLIYGSFIGASSLLAIKKEKFRKTNLLMPFIMYMVHMAYGIGTIVGLVKGKNWKKEYLKNRKIEYLQRKE